MKELPTLPPVIQQSGNTSSALQRPSGPAAQATLPVDAELEVADAEPADDHAAERLPQRTNAPVAKSASPFTLCDGSIAGVDPLPVTPPRS